MRLKLYLSLLWKSKKAPHDTQFPARAWAELLDLREPDRLGARRIKDSIDWLERNRFLRVERVPGLPSRLILLDDGGRGKSYKVPGKIGEIYIKLPSSFWVNGWLQVLSASAIAFLLISLDQGPGWFWLSPEVARKTYGLSPDTRLRASNELQDRGLLRVRHIPVNEHEFGWRRIRKSYRLLEERLESLVTSG